MSFSNASASKFGCFTCKIRRIKCDEDKPTCQRCLRSDRVCKGYPKGAPASNSPDLKSSTLEIGQHEKATIALTTGTESISYTLNINQGVNASQKRFAQLGCTVFADDPFRSTNSLESAFWVHLLPQLSTVIPSVNAAVAAFGARYEWRKLENHHNLSDDLVFNQYQTAIRVLRKDVETLPYGIIPVLMSCILLACTETLGRCHTDALIHLKGACELLARRKSDKHLKAIEDTSNPKKNDSNTDHDDEISTLLRRLDLQAQTYALGSLPNLKLSSKLKVTAYWFENVEDASQKLSRLQHACYGFAAEAMKYKYRPSEAPANFWVEQGRHISFLKSWLMCLEKNVLKSHDSPRADKNLPSQALRHAYVLRAQCFSTIIYMSIILTPYESTFDQFDYEFGEIIKCGQMVLDADCSLQGDKSLPRFSPDLGIIQPLFITALKCREPNLRRKALSLVRKAGTEGPWSGEVEASVAAKVIELEESSMAQSQKLGTDSIERIEERYRVCGCGVEEESRDPKLPRWASLEISRCRDVEYMISGEVSYEDPIHWEKMFEMISIT